MRTQITKKWISW